MSFELSSIITDLQKQGISVAASGKTNAREVAVALRERFGGAQAPDFIGLQFALVRLVEDDLGRLLSLDATHVREVVGSRLQIKERDAAFSEVFGILSDIRSAFEGVYGEEARIELFGEVSALPQVPLELHRLGERIHDLLLSEELVLPPVRLAGFQPLEQEQLAAGLKRPLDRFGQSLATLSLDRKDTDVTLRDKTTGIEGYQRTVRFAAGCLVGLYGLAGFDDLADKIRPKRRASRRPNGSGPTDTAGSPDDGGGDEAGSSEGGSESSDEGDAAPGDASPDGSPEPLSGDEGARAVERTGPIGIVT